MKLVIAATIFGFIEVTSALKCCPGGPVCESYSNLTQGCCNGKVYDKENFTCCQGQLIRKHEKCCNGMVLDTKSYVCCQGGNHEQKIQIKTQGHDTCCIVNGQIKLYDNRTQECGYNGIKQINTIYPCMSHGYNNVTDLCCGDNHFVKNGIVLNMNCCGDIPYFKRKETCCNGQIQVKSQPCTNKYKPKMCQQEWCGLTSYCMTTDLCCQGVFEKNGILNNMGCCGVTAYSRKKQTCCYLSQLINISEADSYMPCSCSPECLKIWLASDMKKIKHLKQQGYKVFTIRKTNEKAKNVWEIVKKGREGKPTRDIGKFTLPHNCECAYGPKTKLLKLLANQTQIESRQITGKFYLLNKAKEQKNIKNKNRKKFGK